MRLDSYPLYKQSGISWYQHIPKDWEVLPLFAIAQECSSSNKGMVEDNLLSLSYGKVINKDINSNDGLLPESFETYQIVEPDDIVLRLTDLQNDKRSLRSAIVKERGIITSAYVAIRPKNVDASFLNYLLRAYDLTKVFYSMGGGLRQSMKFSDVRRLPLIFPSLLEQKSIATFLDHETVKIDTLVAAQEKLIELLSKKRQAVISHAVTKGLDPKVELKDSGVEWLGEIPKHWSVKKLKYGYSVVLGKMLQPEISSIDDELLPYLRATNIQWKNVNVEDVKKMWLSKNDKKNLRLIDGDLLVSEGGDVGRSCLWRSEIEECYFQNSVNRIRSKKYDLNAYLYYWIFIIKESGYIDVLCNKSTIAHFTAEKLENVIAPFPPVEEQTLIVDYLDKETTKIDTLIFESEKAIKLLNERRSALISAVVTGQIDVRNYKAKEVA